MSSNFFKTLPSELALLYQRGSLKYLVVVDNPLLSPPSPIPSFGQETIPNDNQLSKTTKKNLLPSLWTDEEALIRGGTVGVCLKGVDPNFPEESNAMNMDLENLCDGCCRPASSPIRYIIYGTIAGTPDLPLLWSMCSVRCIRRLKAKMETNSLGE